MTLPSEHIQIDREFLMARRQALLLELDALERILCISPRVSELRKEAKNQTHEEELKREE
jgi:hypothetical protein